METDIVCTRTAPVSRSVDAAELRADAAKLRGYAVVYGQPTPMPVPIGRDYAREIIDPGAFDDSLKSGRNVTFVFDHADTAEYGDTASGTLRLLPDAKGIGFELTLPPYAGTLRRLVESGEVSGMSFQFVPRVLETRDTIRHVVKADLLHISPVYSPAYPQTSVTVGRSGGPGLDYYAREIRLRQL